MPAYTYTAKNKDGKVIEGLVEEPDLDSAVALLQAKGLTVLTIKKQRNPKAQDSKRRRMILKQRLGIDDLLLFARQMHTLLDAGVALLKSLDIIIRQVESRPLRDALRQIYRDVEEGSSFNEAIAKHPKVFSPIWGNLIQTGETSGQMGMVFQQLAKYLETSGTIQKRIKSALIYPAILLAVSVVAILIFTLKIIPMFGEVYKGFDIELPFLTSIVLNISIFIRKFFLMFLIVAALAFVALKRYVSTKRGRFQFDNIMLKMPVVNKITEGMVIERFAQGLKTLITSGIPILLSLDIVSRLIDNRVVEEVMEDVKTQVRNGKVMSEPMERSGIFPPVVTQMITVGEETGKLSDMLERIAVYYSEQMTLFIDRFTAMLEPMLLIVMGATVGVLVTAMYLPIFKIATSTM